jgi:hypothetical protein
LELTRALIQHFFNLRIATFPLSSVFPSKTIRVFDAQRVCLFARTHRKKETIKIIRRRRRARTR